MTKRKPKQTLFRDEQGRFVSLPPEVIAKFEAMRPQKVWYEDCGGNLWGAMVDEFTPTGDVYRSRREDFPIDITRIVSTRGSWFSRFIKRVFP
jgi:hypothetical protein